MAAKNTIASIERFCELGELDPETIVTPGIFVKHLVLRRDQAAVATAPINLAG